MGKAPEAFRTISEVSDWLDTPPHVLRFWESKFAQIRPVKRAGGRRYYRPDDMALLAGIKHLLHEQGMTIKGVQKLLRERGVRHVAALSPLLPPDAAEGAADLAATVAADHEAEPLPEAAPSGEEAGAGGGAAAADAAAERLPEVLPRVAPAAPPPEPARAAAPRRGAPRAEPVPLPEIGLLQELAALPRHRLRREAPRIAALLARLEAVAGRLSQGG